MQSELNSTQSALLMHWEEVTPGRYERPLDDIEIFFKNISDQGAALNREHWAVGICAEFQYSSTVYKIELALRRTWLNVRYDHPELASYVEKEKKVYDIPSPEALDKWMSETFHVKPTSSAVDVFSSAPPSHLSNLYYFPQTSEILILFSHWRIDGIGALHLLNNYFKALAAPRTMHFGNEWQNLSPGLSTAADLSQYPSKENIQTAETLLQRYTSNVPSIGLPNQVEEQIPGDTQLVKLTFSASTTLKVVSACRRKGYSVTTAVHAALVIATQRLTPKDTPLSRRYTSWGAINLRPYLQPPYDKPTHAVSVYLVGFPVTLTPGNFSDNALQLRDIYASFSAPEPDFDLRDCLAPYIKKATALFGQPPSENTSAPTEPILDSLGLVDRYVHRDHGEEVEIKNFWLASNTLSRQIGVYVWTWQERLVFHACYNVAFYKPDYVRCFVEQVKTILLAELEIDQGESC